MRIGDVLTVQQAKNAAGDAVAIAAFPGHDGQRKIPCAQQKAGIVHMQAFGHAQGIRNGVLAVAVRGNNEAARGTIVLQMFHAGAQRIALAVVLGITQHMHARIVLRQCIKNGGISVAGAIVHHHNGSKTGSQQRIHMGCQFGVRFEAGDQNGGIARVFVWHVQRPFPAMLISPYRCPDNRSAAATNPRRCRP